MVFLKQTAGPYLRIHSAANLGPSDVFKPDSRCHFSLRASFWGTLFQKSFKVRLILFCLKTPWTRAVSVMHNTRPEKRKDAVICTWTPPTAWIPQAASTVLIPASISQTISVLPSARPWLWLRHGSLPDGRALFRHPSKDYLPHDFLE